MMTEVDFGVRYENIEGLYTEITEGLYTDDTIRINTNNRLNESNKKSHLDKKLIVILQEKTVTPKDKATVYLTY